MGLFAARPEDPFDWAGLPSEPSREHTDAEYLDDPPADPFAIAPGSGAGSITIAIPASGGQPASVPSGEGDDPHGDDDDA